MKYNLWFTLLAAFTVGAAIMSLEMLASRYLNPYFGGTIFTWSALISIVLLAMMAGYFAGGYSVDKISFPYVLESLIVIAALYLLALPLFVDPVLEWVVGAVEDVKLGALIGAFLITGPPVACLSTFTPIAIGRTLSDLHQTGRISGTIFAVSTFGNIFGTLLTSFYLIPLFGTRILTQSLAVVLGLALCLCLLARMRRSSTATLLIATVCLGGAMTLPDPAFARTEQIIAQKAGYPEGPVFIDGALYYTEMTRNRVMKVNWQEGGKKKPQQFYYQSGCGPTSLAAFKTDKIVILCHLSDELIITNRAGKKIRAIRQAQDGTKIFHPNDSVKDGKGGVYITAPGHFAKRYQPMGLLFYLNAKGEVLKLKDRLTYPNGIAIFNNKLYLAEHLANRVMKYQIKQAGHIGKGEHFITLPDAIDQNKKKSPLTKAQIGPDGIEIGKDGKINVAHYGAGQILIFDQTGKLKRSIKTIPQFVTNITLSSQDGLVVTGADKLETVLQEGMVYYLAKHIK